MPDGSLWVSSDGVSGKLYKIDGRSMKVLGAFDTGYSPLLLLIDSSGKAVWATLRYNNEIRKYDCDKGSLFVRFRSGVNLSGLFPLLMEGVF